MNPLQLENIKSAISKHIETIFDQMLQLLLNKIDDKIQRMNSCYNHVESIVSQKVTECKNIASSLKKIDEIINTLEKMNMPRDLSVDNHIRKKFSSLIKHR